MRKKDLKIAMIAPSFGDIGGPEVVTQNLTNALIEKGLDVTLFAPGDWKTKAKHISTLPKSLWNMKDFKDQTEYERRNLILLSQLSVLKHQQDFDILHIQSQRYAYAVAELSEKPCVLTIHNNIAVRDFNQIKKAGVYPVALSEEHGRALKTSAIISNGIETKKIRFSFAKGDYLITIGRLAEAKGIDRAIKIAERANKKLLIFGRIGNSPERQAYFNTKIKPALNNKIIYMGEASQKDIFRYMKKAEALLFPITPPGRDHLRVVPLVVMEALACGTPIIGAPISSIPKEIKSPGVSCLSNDLDVLTQAAKATGRFNRKKCRELAEKYFDSSVMAKKYIELYQKILLKSALDKKYKK